MKQLLLRLLGAILICTLVLPATAQTGVLNPADPIVVYNPAAPPATPPYGQLAKWVKTNRLNWNTSSFKAYYYKGMVFRVKFPKTYQHGVADGKKYPLMVFFHGKGERGTIYDNEYQLYHGGQTHMNAVDQGKFDGFLLYPQNTTGYYGEPHYEFIKELINNYFIPEVKVDPNRIVVNGLSAGGEGVWRFAINDPKLVAGITPISNANLDYRNYANQLKFVPIWHFQGGQDNNPTPGTSEEVGKSILAVGGNYRYTLYPNQGHGCWNSAWAEADYFPYLSRAHQANPWPLGGRSEFCANDIINIKIGVQSGFAEYEWRKDGVVIPGATGNELTVTTVGTYDVRFRRGSEWTPFSPIPLVVKIKEATVTPPITVNGLMSKVIPSLDGNTFTEIKVPTGYSSYVWQKVGSDATIGTDSVLRVTTPGEYRVKVTEKFGCSSDFSAPFTVVDAEGPNAPDAAINVSVAGISKTALKLDWSENPSPVNNETGYEIYRSSDSGGPYQLVHITGPNVVSYTDNGLNSNSTYFYIIRAVNGTGSSAPTTEASGTTQADVVKPAAPTNLVVTSTSRNSIGIAWSAATDDVAVVKYDVYIDGEKAFVTTKTNFTAYNLEFGRTYTFSVRARDFANNQSPFSNQVTAQARRAGMNYRYYLGSFDKLPDFSTLTPAKTGVTAGVSIAPRTQNDLFAFVWEGFVRIPVNGTYTFRTNSDDGSKLYIGALNQGTSAYSHTATALVDNDGLHGAQNRDGTITLTAGIYPIAVTFFEKTGSGENCTVSWRTPQTNNVFTALPDSALSDVLAPAGTAPAAPSAVVATANGYNKINVGWTDNSDNESGFEIWRAVNQQLASFVPVGRAGANASSFVDTSVAPNTTYYYRVRAIGQYGESAFDAQPVAGVNYSYYEQLNMSNLPNFPAMTPVKTGVSSTITLGMENRADNFALKFDGYIYVPTAATYTFFTNSDEGSKLYIGGFDEANRVVDNNGTHTVRERSGTKVLQPGIYPITVTYFERTNAQSLSVSVSATGIGIPKMVIPASQYIKPFAFAKTASLPGVPAEPTDLTAVAASTSAITVNWADNAANEDKYELYRSSNNNGNYVLRATLDANTTSYQDTGLFANATYYYKVRALNAGGFSNYTNEGLATTLNNLPQLQPVSNQYVRFGTQRQLNIQATDADPGTLTLTVANLPAFATFTDNGNGTGVLTLSPSNTDQGAYNNITVQVSDQHAGTASVSFNLVVNDNYNPAVGAVSNVTVSELQTAQVNIGATDQNANDALTLSLTGLPPFATATINGGAAQIQLAPGYTHNGTYTVKALVQDGNFGSDSATFTITVTDVNPNKKVFVNFTDGSQQAPAPWNNTNKVPALNDNFANLKDETGANSGIGLVVTTNWAGIGNGTNVLGAKTGNNSGVYPDNVIRSAYWSTTVAQTFRITGLNAAYKYNFTMFGSRGGVNDNRTTVYTIKGTSVSLNAAGNTSNTVSINSVQPEADGTLTLTIKNGTGSSFSYLNALVIEALYDDGSVPAKPRSLTAGMNNGKVRLNWVDAAYNENAYEVYRGTSTDGPFTLLNPGGNNANLVQYEDGTTAGNVLYHYYVRALNAYGASANSDTASFTTPNIAPVLTQLNDAYVKTEQVVALPVTASDPGDNITLTATGLPSFASFTDNGNGTGSIQVNAGLNLGSYPGITVTAKDSKGLTASQTFKLTITDKDIQSLYVNFNQFPATAGPSPWNAFSSLPLAGRSIASLKDETSTATSVSITLVDGWEGANEAGGITGNNSGVFPDDVMKTAYFESTTNAKRIRLSGLDVSKKYNLVFFASRVGTDPRPVVYSAQGKSVTLNATSNTKNTVQLNGLTPDGTGNIEFTVVKGAGGSFAYLNALVIQAYTDLGLPLAPANLVASAKTKTSVQLTWSDKSDNETGFELYRATSANGVYSLVTTVASNVTGYNDANLKENTSYFYKVRTVANGVYSSYSNTASTSTFAFLVHMNFNRDLPAAAPWNNTNNVPMVGSVYSNLMNELTNPTGMDLTVMTDFSGENPFGMVTGDNSGVFPDNVIRSSWWLDFGVTSKVKVSGLSQNMEYNFVFFGSRNGPGDKTTVYSIGNKSASLQAAYNVSNTATIEKVRADENGEVEITVSLGPTAQFGYLGAFVIQAYKPAADAPAQGGNPTLVSASTQRFATVNQQVTAAAPSAARDRAESPALAGYPNPFENAVTLSTRFEKAEQQVSVQVRDVSGKVVYTRLIGSVPEGAWTYRLQLGSALAPGMYTLQLVRPDSNQPPATVKLLKTK